MTTNQSTVADARIVGEACNMIREKRERREERESCCMCWYCSFFRYDCRHRHAPWKMVSHHIYRWHAAPVENHAKKANSLLLLPLNVHPFHSFHSPSFRVFKKKNCIVLLSSHICVANKFLVVSRFKVNIQLMSHQRKSVATQRPKHQMASLAQRTFRIAPESENTRPIRPDFVGDSPCSIQPPVGLRVGL